MKVNFFEDVRSKKSLKVIELGCGSGCFFPCPFGYPCLRNTDCYSRSCTSYYCDVGKPASFSNPNTISPEPSTPASVTSASSIALKSSTAQIQKASPSPSLRILTSSSLSAVLSQPTVISSDPFIGKASYYGDGYQTGGKEDPPPLGPENGGWYGACYDLAGTPKNWNKFAALNSIQYKALGAPNVCGKCARLHYEGRTTVVQIVDMCPGCPNMGVDISHAAFADLVGSYDRAIQLGIIYGMTWNFTSCLELSVDPVFRGHNYIVGSP